MADMELVRVIALDEEATEPEAGQYLLVDSAEGTKKMKVDNLLQAATLSDNAKTSLLNCFAHVAWTDDRGQDYYDALENALYPNVFPKITAVFTPGTHNIYADDNLNSLKQYLVVKYYETEESSGVEIASTDYTLSGTLTEGTNTIIVSYQSLSTAFSVTAENYYNRHSWVLQDDDTLSIASGKTGDVRTVPSTGYSSVQYVIEANSARATILSNHGEDGTEAIDSNGNLMDYYFIPIPADSTNVRIDLSPSSLYAYLGFVVCWAHEGGTGHHFYRHQDSGWVQTGSVVSFTHRDNQFLAINFKANSAGTGTVSVSNVTLTFNEN